MSAMEKMLASMLGITPEKLQQIMTQSMQMLETINNRFERIEQKLDLIAENYTHEVDAHSLSDEEIKFLEAKNHVNGHAGN